MFLFFVFIINPMKTVEKYIFPSPFNEHGENIELQLISSHTHLIGLRNELRKIPKKSSLLLTYLKKNPERMVDHPELK